MVYRLFPAKDYDENQKYPLILFLHGSGERGNDNRLQVEHNFPDLFITDAGQSTNPCFVLAPQCPKDLSWSGETIRQVKAIMDSLSNEFSIDQNRLYVVGLSMGGRGTFNILNDFPGHFAAAVPCAGGNDTAELENLIQTPMWLHCATNDRSIMQYYSLVQRLREKDRQVTWFKSNRNLSEPNMPWETVVSEVDRGASFLFCEVLDGFHQDSWIFAWRNPQLSRWLFSKSKN
ncbi:MAG: prolyl oligopeptidase family serine peptidase [Planctomycetaceae bacterium]|nr:prolyl oligopeptidase family serine peptidase [Planctomycetaceae bacterium]